MERRLADGGAPASDRRAAYAELADLDAAAAKPEANVPQALVLNLLRAGMSVALEVACGGVGTFVWPGIGTYVGSAGGALAWALL